MKNDILLVEDDASLAASLEQVLSLAGYNVTVATNGEAGLEHARAGCFAAAVTDFRLPRLSGLELVKQFYAANRRTPIILMTAHGSAELAIEAAIPRPESANLPPPTASDFKMEATTASIATPSKPARYRSVPPPSQQVAIRVTRFLVVGSARKLTVINLDDCSSYILRARGN